MATTVTAEMLNGDGKDTKDTLTTSLDAKETDGKPPEGIEPKPPLEGFGEVEEEDKPPEKPLKYKSHEEAEKAYREAEKKLHESTTETAKLKKVVEDLQKRIDGVEKKADPNQKGKWEVEQDRILNATIDAANKLSTDDPDYNMKLAKVWMKGQADIAKIAAQEERERQEIAANDLKVINTTVDKALEAAELDKIPGIQQLFWAQASGADKNLSLEDQIAWTIAQCKAIVDGIRGKETARYQEEQKNRSKFDILQRGGKPVSKTSQDEGTQTMGDAIRAVKERRKLR